MPLSEVGISNWDLIRGLSCVVGDFDSNGYLDFGFRGRAPEGEEGLPTLRVVFYERDKVLRTIDLRDYNLVLYPATDLEGEFGEPASKWDGLVSWGEGGSTFVYLYDPETGTFRVSEHASENARGRPPRRRATLPEA